MLLLLLSKLFSPGGFSPTVGEKPVVCVCDELALNFAVQKDWREKRDEFKKIVRRLVRKSQEML